MVVAADPGVLGGGRLQPPDAACAPRRTPLSPAWKPSWPSQVALVRKHLPPTDGDQPAGARSRTVVLGRAARRGGTVRRIARRRAHPAAGAAWHRRAGRGARCAGHGLGAGRARRRARPGRPASARYRDRAARAAGVADPFGGRRCSITRWSATTRRSRNFRPWLLAWLFGFKPGLVRRLRAMATELVRSAEPASAIHHGRRGPAVGRPSPPLWRLLQADRGNVAVVARRAFGYGALDRVERDLRPGVQALAFQALRNLGRAQALRQRLAQRAPACTGRCAAVHALALCWREAQAPYEVFTLVDQAVEAAKRSGDSQGAGRVSSMPACAASCASATRWSPPPTPIRWRAGIIRAGGSSGCSRTTRSNGRAILEANNRSRP